MNIKKRFFTALSILLCALCLALTGCGAEPQAESALPAGFESVAVARSNHFSLPQLGGISAVVDHYDCDGFYPGRVGGEDFLYTIDLTGAGRSTMELRFPLELEDGTAVDGSASTRLFWYADGGLYAVCYTPKDRFDHILVRVEPDGDGLRGVQVSEGFLGEALELLATEDAVYLTVSEPGETKGKRRTTVRRVDLATGAAEDLLYVEDSILDVHLLDCDGRRLYVLEETCVKRTIGETNKYSAGGITLRELGSIWVRAIDLATGETEYISDDIPAATRTAAYKGSIYYMKNDERTLMRLDIATGECFRIAKSDTELWLSPGVAGDMLCFTSTGKGWFSLRTGEFLRLTVDGLPVWFLEQQVEDRVVFTTARPDGFSVRYIAPAEQLAEGDLSGAQLLEIPG